MLSQCNAVDGGSNSESFAQEACGDWPQAVKAFGADFIKVSINLRKYNIFYMYIYLQGWK